jgi:hypothetical protein
VEAQLDRQLDLTLGRLEPHRIDVCRDVAQDMVTGFAVETRSLLAGETVG